jgi:hypothetical protein
MNALADVRHDLAIAAAPMRRKGGTEARKNVLFLKKKHQKNFCS